MKRIGYRVKGIGNRLNIAYYLLAFTSYLMGCNSPFTPKPTGYFAIPFPEKKYQTFDKPGYPYAFEYPVYASVAKDSIFFGETNENPWWININFPQFNGRIYISYKDIKKNNFDTLVKHAFTLTGKHTVKAYAINDSVIHTKNNVEGIFFTVSGDVATANQFFLTDSTRHFLRGALYFDATPNADSLGIVNKFLIEDVKYLINSFRWKNR
jgi:gliding motility-associated lipoprotein GldD